MNMENINSEWDLIKEGKFLDAYKLLSNHIDENPHRKYRYLYNRALCLLNLGQPEKALLDFSDLIVEKPELASGYLGAGISSWWLAKPDKATIYWKKALDAKYTDSANGIEPPLFLLFAAVKLRDSNLEKHALSLLRKNFKLKYIVKWPNAIGSYLLGNIDSPTFYKSATSDSNAIKQRRLCKFYFWVALNYYRENNIEEYYRNLNLSLHTESMLEPEFYLAKYETSLVT